MLKSLKISTKIGAIAVVLTMLSVLAISFFSYHYNQKANELKNQTALSS
ncbi:MAG: hypothetical protein ACK57K_06390 [Chryseotalea sp.]